MQEEPGSDHFAKMVHFTSEEVDSLIEELRAAKFEYDPTVPVREGSSIFTAFQCLNFDRSQQGSWRCKTAALAQSAGGSFCRNASCVVQLAPGTTFCSECGTPTGQ